MYDHNVATSHRRVSSIIGNVPPKCSNKNIYGRYLKENSSRWMMRSEQKRVELMMDIAQKFWIFGDSGLDVVVGINCTVKTCLLLERQSGILGI